jgi:hypothetical protein
MREIGSTAEAAYAADEDMGRSFCISEQNVFPQGFSPRV